MLLGRVSRITPSGTLISLAVMVVPGSRLSMVMRPSSPVMYSPLFGPITALLESVIRKVTPFRG
jgi:hypothetical protein